MSNKNINIQLASPGTVVFLCFFFAKILGYVSWSWWMITSPLWVPIVIVLGIVGVWALFALIAVLLETI